MYKNNKSLFNQSLLSLKSLAKLRTYLTIFVLAVFLTACGGCSGGDSDDGSSSSGGNQNNPVPESGKLPIGMNVGEVNYYTEHVMFTDVMKTASKWLTTCVYDADTCSDAPWNSGMRDEIEYDVNGWPTHVPQSTSHHSETIMRFLISDCHEPGRYRILFDGDGDLDGSVEQDGDGYYVDLDGDCTNTWIDILRSDISNPVRNMKIIREDLVGTDYPTFIQSFLDGLRPFHVLRFMDTIHTNGSPQMHWEDRSTPEFYTQGDWERGVAFEYLIELANELDVDVWVTVPHMASDEYMRSMARMYRDNLKPGLKIYLEYSNELWNWIFEQAHWVLCNGDLSENQWLSHLPLPADDYVSADLAAINPECEAHPEKDAYMMARTFRIWSEEFGEDAVGSRLIRVAGVQTAWVGNTGRILRYLFETDGIGCDAIAGTAYFSFSSEQHEDWLTKGNDLTFDQIYQDVYDTSFADGSPYVSSVIGTADYASQYGIDYLIYEGGQHMQPYRQEEWNYNQRLWDFQIDPLMYSLYQTNFELHTRDDVGVKLYMAFSYVGDRESRWGSWGHLENLQQIGTDYMTTAPKYQALLDYNTSKGQ